MNITKHFTDKWHKTWFEFIIQQNNWFETTRNPYNFAWFCISQHPNATLDLITNNINIPWDWKGVSVNPNLTINMIRRNMNKKWDWGEISMNCAINMNDVDGNLDLPWDWRCLSLNPNLTMEMVNKHPYKEWDWSYISNNSNISIEDVKNNMNKPWDWNFSGTLKNALTERIPEMQLDWFGMSLNKQLTIQFINDNPSENWDWDEISANGAFTMDDISNNLDKPWRLGAVSINPNFTIDMEIKHPTFIPVASLQQISDMFWFTSVNWDWAEISRHPNTTINTICKYPNKPWKWHMIVYFNPFQLDKQHYIAHYAKNANLLQMHNFFHKNTDKVISPIEYVIFDEYLLKSMLQY